MRRGNTEGRGASGQNFDEQEFINASQNAKSSYGRFNLAVIGNTGVGKSSLVNAVFGRNLAQVGMGLPVTQGVNYYHDATLGIWDVEGFEIGSSRHPAQTLKEHLRVIASRPAWEQIGVVWYCVAANSDRLTQQDIDMIRELHAAGLPVILVLTKVDWAKNPVTGSLTAPASVQRFKAWLENPVDAQGHPLYLPVRRVILTSTQDSSGKGSGHGLGELVEETLALSPENEKDAFRIAQVLNLPWKKDMVKPIIGAAASAAAAAAAVPIPVADAVVLAPIQMTMMGRIAAVYDLELKSMLGTSALAQLSAQFAGKALARSFIKLIPGAGVFINAGVAGGVTVATGEAWRQLCERVYTGKLDPALISGSFGKFSPSIVNVVAGMAARRIGRI